MLVGCNSNKVLHKRVVEKHRHLRFGRAKGSTHMPIGGIRRVCNAMSISTTYRQNLCTTSTFRERLDDTARRN